MIIRILIVGKNIAEKNVFEGDVVRLKDSKGDIVAFNEDESFEIGVVLNTKNKLYDLYIDDFYIFTSSELRLFYNKFIDEEYVIHCIIDDKYLLLGNLKEYVYDKNDVMYDWQKETMLLEYKKSRKNLSPSIKLAKQKKAAESNRKDLTKDDSSSNRDISKIKYFAAKYDMESETIESVEKWNKKYQSQNKIPKKITNSNLTDNYNESLEELMQGFQNYDSIERIDDIKKIKDQDKLICIAKNSPSWQVRQAAVKEIKNGYNLADIALHDLNSNVCQSAVNNVYTDNILSFIIKFSHDFNTQLAAVKRIYKVDRISGIFRFNNHLSNVLLKDNNVKEEILIAIAKNTCDEDICLEAVKRITDDVTLANFAKHNNFDIRMAAVKNIDNDNILAGIVYYNNPRTSIISYPYLDIEKERELEESIKLAAVERIDNPKILLDIVKNTESRNVRLAALKRIPMDIREKREKELLKKTPRTPKRSPRGPLGKYAYW